MNHSGRKLSSILAVWLVTAFMVASVCNAQTLYERSMAALEGNAQKSSEHEFTFVVLGDSKDSDEIFKKSLKLATTFNPLFILHGGDFSDKGSIKEVDHFLEIVQRTVPGIPLFVVPGNHEQKRPFTEKIGPLSFSIDNARLGFKLIILDNSNYALRPPQLKYLEEQLGERRKLRFVAMHIPPITERWSWHAFSEGAPELMRLLAGKKVTAVFYGHIHMYDRDDIQGVPHIISGGAGASLTRYGFPGDPSYHIVVVRVKEGKVTYQIVKIKE